MKKQRALTAVGILVATSVLATPVVANAASAPSPSATRTVAASAPWSSVDWLSVADDARTAGDLDGAEAAALIHDRLATGAADSPTQRNLWTSLAKKAVLQILKHATSKLPAKIRPYAHKIIAVIEEIDSFQQTAVVAALTRAGIPYDVSVATAQWIVFFLGL